MTDEAVAAIGEALEARGVVLAPGLTAGEIADVEEVYGFHFPPDLRRLLEAFLPSGEDFPDWRQPHRAELIEWFDFPAEGIAFDVEENDFWLEEWGERPEDPEEAAEVARTQVAQAPVLIPIFGHRFLPATPGDEGNPVFSVVQTDIIEFAPDLASYFHQEFGAPQPRKVREARRIPFWSDLAQ